MIEQIMFWLVLLIVLLGIEMATLGLTTIWFAGGALIAILAALLNAPIWVQICGTCTVDFHKTGGGKVF